MKSIKADECNDKQNGNDKGNDTNNNGEEERKKTRKTKSSKEDEGNDNNNGNDKGTAADKDKVINSSPTWPFLCQREIENARREGIEKMGFIPAFDADMAALAKNYGKMAAEGKEFLATLSDDSDDESWRDICAHHVKFGRSNLLE
jgi:hypothetical protein